MSQNKTYLSYIRVSTQRQGQSGTSLNEQKAAIERYAQKENLTMVKHFEEKETAAKRGRPVFLEMLKELRKGHSSGVIIHKVDRSARNLKDWADLGTLIDAGVEVHFAGENLDLNSRGGRLSADIQAVVASDFIRNLRQEVKKGFYGRLKQGLYPRPAPIGYLNQGKGKPKIPDPIRSPLIKKAFELYASERFSIPRLVKKLNRLGLRNKSGNAVSQNGVNILLKNSFYTGLIRIKKTGEIYKGIHEPIISLQLFDKVQRILKGKRADKKQKHFFIFSRFITCGSCLKRLIAEKQKGIIYYRCHKRHCDQKTIREDIIDKELLERLKSFGFSDKENLFLKQAIRKKYGELDILKENKLEVLNLQLEKCNKRLSRLIDFYVDEKIDRKLFVEKKNSLVRKQQQLESEIKDFDRLNYLGITKTEAFLELLNQAYISYKWGTPEERREIVKFVTSNLTVSGKSVLIKPSLPFEILQNWRSIPGGRPRRLIPRTFLQKLFDNLLDYFAVPKNEPLPKGF